MRNHFLQQSLEIYDIYNDYLSDERRRWIKRLKLLEVNSRESEKLLIISTQRKQRVGDILAGTVVVSADTRWGVGFDPGVAT